MLLPEVLVFSGEQWFVVFESPTSLTLIILSLFMLIRQLVEWSIALCLLF
jgi:hypothetical protein